MSTASSPAPESAKPGHEGYSRIRAEDPDTVMDHRSTACPDCGPTLSYDLPAETVSVHERIERPELKPVDAVRAAPGRHGGVSENLRGYVRPEVAEDLWESGLRVTQGGLTKMPCRAETRFEAGRQAAPLAGR